LLPPLATGQKLNFSIIFHDSPAHVDPLEFRKEIKNVAHMCPTFVLPGGLDWIKI